ncbi:MAG: class I SAM-dependent methyltransferase [Paracoccaceae bacterium]|nr:class I SAM-dependent methyltransferase [Paracoccaceae bacterium]
MADQPNRDSADYWSGPSGQSWIAREEEMDHLLEDVARLVIEEGNPVKGARVIDIGCGTGALSLMAAEAVGPEGRVLASDISEPLLQRAAERGANLPQMGVHLADAESAEWPETGFDLAVSRFGVMFFANPEGAFANIARALRPGGRIVFAAWAPATRNPYWTVPRDRASERLGAPPAVPPNTPGPMGLSDLDLAVARLRAGGLQNVEGREVAARLSHRGSAASVADLMTRLGSASRIISHFGGTEGDRAAIAGAIAGDLAQYEMPEGTEIPATINLLTAIAA